MKPNFSAPLMIGRSVHFSSGGSNHDLTVDMLSLILILLLLLTLLPLILLICGSAGDFLPRCWLWNTSVSGFSFPATKCGEVKLLQGSAKSAHYAAQSMHTHCKCFFCVFSDLCITWVVLRDLCTYCVMWFMCAVTCLCMVSRGVCGVMWCVCGVVCLCVISHDVISVVSTVSSLTEGALCSLASRLCQLALPAVCVMWCVCGVVCLCVISHDVISVVSTVSSLTEGALCSLASRLCQLALPAVCVVCSVLLLLHSLCICYGFAASFIPSFPPSWTFEITFISGFYHSLTVNIGVVSVLVCVTVVMFTLSYMSYIHVLCAPTRISCVVVGLCNCCHVHTVIYVIYTCFMCTNTHQLCRCWFV